MGAQLLSAMQHVYAMPTSVTQGSAYSRGYNDASCDAVLCKGHGYDPRCPGDHSSEYCSNYKDGYAAERNASMNANNQVSAKGYWAANDTAILSSMRAYHIFIDRVNEVFGPYATNAKKDKQLTHDGLQVGLENMDNFKRWWRM